MEMILDEVDQRYLLGELMPASYHLEDQLYRDMILSLIHIYKEMARKKIIAGNWKMNKTPSEAVALVEELKPLVANEEVDRCV